MEESIMHLFRMSSKICIPSTIPENRGTRQVQHLARLIRRNFKPPNLTSAYW
jgi:hypothetical protein